MLTKKVSERDLTIQNYHTISTSQPKINKWASCLSKEEPISPLNQICNYTIGNTRGDTATSAKHTRQQSYNYRGTSKVFEYNHASHKSIGNLPSNMVKEPRLDEKIKIQV